MAEESLKQKTAKGLFWGLVNNGSQQFLNLVFGIFLSRLLTPADYGMVGMLSIFSLVAASLQESGFTAALANKKRCMILTTMPYFGSLFRLVFHCIGYCFF